MPRINLRELTVLSFADTHHKHTWLTEWLTLLWLSTTPVSQLSTMSIVTLLFCTPLYLRTIRKTESKQEGGRAGTDLSGRVSVYLSESLAFICRRKAEEDYKIYSPQVCKHRRQHLGQLIHGGVLIPETQKDRPWIRKHHSSQTLGDLDKARSLRETQDLFYFIYLSFIYIYTQKAQRMWCGA